MSPNEDSTAFQPAFVLSFSRRVAGGRCPRGRGKENAQLYSSLFFRFVSYEVRDGAVLVPVLGRIVDSCSDKYRLKQANFE